MSDIEKKINQEKPGGAGGKKVPTQDTGDYETKELSMEELAKRMELEKKRNMKADLAQADITRPMTAVKIPEPKKKEEEKPGEKLPEPSDVDLRTQRVPDELPVKKEDMEIEHKPLKKLKETGSMPVDTLPELEDEISVPEPVRTPTSSLTRVLLMIMAVLLIILFYFMFKRGETPPVMDQSEETGTTEVTKKPETSFEEIQPAETDTDTVMDITAIRPAEKKKEPILYKLSNELFQGTAPLKVKEKGPVISEENDPEIAAIGDALRIRVETILGSKTRTRRGIETKTTSGKFHGFKVSNTFQRKGDQVIRNETSLVTPSRGWVMIKGNILDAIRKTDYEKFHRELEVAGIEVIKTPVTDEGIINVQLRVTKLFGRPVKPGFLIGSSSVGGVKLGMPIKMLESVLPHNKYIVIEKEILHEDKFYDTYKVCDLQIKPLFFINAKENKVWGIQVVSDRFKTARGLGIGDTLAEFRINYLKNTDIKIGATPGGIPFVSIDEVTGMFLLQEKGINFVTQVFPNDAEITYVLLGGSPFIE